jgi:predicted ATPase
MGEVYRARDTRLGRTVAIKVLAAHASQSGELARRLENEARTISQLSHPNICTLHDIGHQDGMNYLVLEMVSGKTLREVLRAGKLSVREMVPIAVQIAEGLAKAHEVGIVHRDLKPENVMVSAESVKILDFGLAKLSEGGDDARGDNTTVGLQTQPDVLLGTIAYMSPEQAKGRGLDFRSDQFSFGVMLYEMATGRRPFEGKTQAQTLLGIMQDDPGAIGALNPEVPPPFCWVVERCLAKEPEKRYFSTRDLARDLGAIRDRLSDLQGSRAEARPSNLPVPGSAFIGREQEVAALSEMLLRRDVRLVTVTGPGGIGKSRLAVEVAREVGGQFPSGVYFVPLAAVSDAALIAVVIAQTLGIRETGGRPALEALKEHLQHSLSGPLLLLIDNFEHVVAAAPLLSEVLTFAPNVKLMVTSRAPLHIYDEKEFPVPPLTLPDAKEAVGLEELGKIPAVALFVQRAAAVKPDFRLTEENSGAVAEICARLDGLPLAIELAAARTKLLSPTAMIARLASSLQLLTGGARDLPARQQTLRQAIDWSYNLLSEAEQRLLRRLAVFRGGCTLDAVESVCDTKEDLELDVLDGMASMVDKSLARQIEQEDGEPRFVMLETIREYALEKLKASEEEVLTRRAHAAYFLVLAEEGAEQDLASKESGWQDRFSVEHDNFRAALDWLTETGNADWGLRIGLALFRFWEMREHFSEGRERLGKLLQLPGAAGRTSARMRATFSAGILASAQSDFGPSDELVRESLEIARALDDKRSVAIAINALAVNARGRGDLARARTLFKESLELWREVQEPQATARALSNLASIVKLQQDYALSCVFYQECLALFRELGDNTGVAWALNHQADVVREQGDFAEAQAMYEQSLEKFRELKDRWGIGATLADLGNLAREQRKYADADSFYRESLKTFQELEHKRGIARVLESFACCAAEKAELERALRLAGAAAALRQSVGAPLTAAEQQKLEGVLDPARQKLAVAVGRTAWLEGWVMPIEKIIGEVLGMAGGRDAGTPAKGTRLSSSTN